MSQIRYGAPLGVRQQTVGVQLIGGRTRGIRASVGVITRTTPYFGLRLSFHPRRDAD
ncbi:MAG: hypothetical protein K6T63_09035 [Alicyclobacillus herbarius]|uniref:hypothetical protein n=1 Tax=Alicyclobacillus herbarius TaxID=122960 RepID=UPI00042553F8|nr:hypothetical protein [Alicyclobacillus herbarius]MCL6632764.1 hypothetical protein [Alicyclobacillus herbarius]